LHANTEEKFELIATSS